MDVNTLCKFLFENHHSAKKTIEDFGLNYFVATALHEDSSLLFRKIPQGVLMGSVIRQESFG